MTDFEVLEKRKFLAFAGTQVVQPNYAFSAPTMLACDASRVGNGMS
jgi:hypothetical protein